MPLDLKSVQFNQERERGRCGGHGSHDTRCYAIRAPPQRSHADAAGAAHRRALEDLRGHARADRRVARHRARRDPCARGPERLRQVDADQDARRLPHARSRQPCGARRRARSTLGQAVPDGLRFVHQDLGLVLELNAMDNLALHGGFARGAMGRVRWREQEEETHRILARFGVDLDIHRPLAAATPVERTVVAIAAALQGWHGGHGVLVLDEPTAVLPHDEVERLFAMVARGAERGHERALRLAPSRRDLRAGRPRDRAARRPRDRHPRRLRHRRGRARERDGRRGGRSGLPRAGGGAAGRAGRARGPRRPRALAARRRPRRPSRRDPRHRRPRGRGRARAAVRDRRLRTARRHRAHPPAGSGPRSGPTPPTPGTSTSRWSRPIAGARGSSPSSPSARTSRCRSSDASAAADDSTSARRRSSSSAGRSASASSPPARTRRSRR